jgi:RHS repeat-associated protein
MKTYAVVVIAVVALALCGTVQAQGCWSDVISWNATLSLSGSGSGSCPQGPECTASDLLQANNVKMTSLFLSCQNDVNDWNGSTSNFTGQLNDTATVPCQGGGDDIYTWVGLQPGSVAGSELDIEQSSGTYLYIADAGGLGTLTEEPCRGDPSSVTLFMAILPATNFPTPLPLPSNVGVISYSYPFNGEEAVMMMVIPWTFSYTLIPNYDDDDDCKDQSGDGHPASSTVGCQNQSLGEDVAVPGTGFGLHYESGRAPGSPGDAIASTDAAMIGGWTLDVHHAYDPNANVLFFGNGTQRNGYQLGTPVSYNGNLLLTSEDGSEVYVFSTAGRHLQTLRPLTGAVEYQFGYDASGNLVTVTNATGNVTTIQRNASEQATAIVSPYGQTTTLAMDANGFLSQVTDPLGNSSTFVNTSTGLLTSRTDPNLNNFTYTYDTNGRLTKDADPLGGCIMASRAQASSGLGYTVTKSTCMGITSLYQNILTIPWIQNGSADYSEQHANTWPNGLVSTASNSLSGGVLSKSVSLPSNVSDSQTLKPDPVWGLQVPVNASETMTEGNLTMKITSSRSTTLGTAGNPFSVTKEVDTRSINGRTYTQTFTGSNRKFVSKSAVGRTITLGLDSLERLSSTQLGTLTATDLTYDSHDRLASATRGTRITTFTYDANGFLASVTDPMQLTTSFAYDADGHLTSTTLPDGRVIVYTYDGNDNVTSVTPPGESAHAFAYNAVDMATTYTPPTVSGTGPTTYAYDLDRHLTKVTRPDGGTIQFGYDSAGRLGSTTTPSATTTYSYDSTTGLVSSASIMNGEALAFGYNGSLQTSWALTGTVAGTVGRTYDNNYWISSESVSGGSTIDFTRDKDGMITKAGSLTIKLNSKDGLITGTTLGSATDARTYDAFGELTSDTAKYGTTALYSLKFTRDADGRISTKTETINGKKNTYAYTYDQAGRLSKVTKNGAAYSSYTYDSNSNRLTQTTSSGTVTGSYDAQDRLLTYGNASFTYTANGELASQTVGAQTTTYTYDALGNLTAATLPNGATITYVIDPENHRVGKEVNGALQTGFLYDGDSVVAQLNASNQVVSQFIYATGSTSPDYMVSGGVTYRIFSDQLGSPVVVVNTSTGAIAEQITYDEFGNVLSDTNPGFQPFGFAGGLYDQDIKLVRFGARDYNPAVGRWTAKDPILFAGGDTNLYGYALSDPINFADPSGEITCEEAKQKIRDKINELVDKAKEMYNDTAKQVQWLLDKATGWVKVDYENNGIGVRGSVGTEVGPIPVEVSGQATVGVSSSDRYLFYVDGFLNATVGKVIGHQWHYHKEIGDVRWHTLGTCGEDNCHGNP